MTFRIIKNTLLGLSCVLFVASCNKQDVAQEVQAQAPRDYYSEVKSLNKLVLAQMTISKMATIDDIDLTKASGMKQTALGMLDAMKIGNRKAAYSYNTYLRAYIDLSQLMPEAVKVDESTKTITLTLPEIQTEFAGRDVTMREEHYRVSGMRSKISEKERAEIKEKMNTALKQEVEERSEFRTKLTAEAKGKCESYFKALLGNEGYIVNVNVK